MTLCVEDTGCGMAPEVAERVFEPYFTTRADGGGTGLGLSNTHALLTDAGCTITLESILGEGTSFMVILPVLV